MMEIEVITTKKELLEGKNGRSCPDCGCTMTEVDRVHEEGFAYIWYECSQINCDGQWLDKRPINNL